MNPLVFVGAEGKSIDLSDEIAKCMVTMVVTTCINGLSLIGLSCALFRLLCPFGLITVCFYVYLQKHLLLLMKFMSSFGCTFKMAKSAFREKYYLVPKALKVLLQEAPVMCFSRIYLQFY